MAAGMSMTSCSSSRAFEQEAYNKAYQPKAEAVVEAPAEAEPEELAAAQAAEAPAADVTVEGEGVIVIDKTSSKERALAKTRKLSTRVVKDVEYVQDAKTGKVIGENVLAEKNLNGFYVKPEGTVIYFNDRPNFGGGLALGLSTPHWDLSVGGGAAGAFKNQDDVHAGENILSWYIHGDAMYCIDLTPKGQLYGKHQLKFGVSLWGYRRQLEEDVTPDLIIDEGVDVEVIKVKSSTVYHRGFTFAPCLKLAYDCRLTNNLHLQAEVFGGPTSEYFKGGSRGRLCGGANLGVIVYFNSWKKINSSVETSARQLSTYNNDRINQMRASQRR